MEVSPLNPTRPEEPVLDHYTIPIRSSWFVWDEIHETESVSLREFFDGTSITRTPKIYREYRDFIINRYREEPSRRLSFTEVRKSLVGDVNLLRKVFEFLENWGLINFSASPVAGERGEGERSVARVCSAIVKIEEGVPSGIRVAAGPNSIKPIAAPPESQSNDPNAPSAGGGAVFKFPPLASYSDVFADSIGKNKDVVVCGNCGGRCDSGHYKYTQGDFLICMKCFERGNYGENKTIDEYKLVEVVQGSPKWSEAETLTLLESVLKYGDNWDLIAQNLPTKNKIECILKLIELPFGDVFGSTPVVGTGNNSSDDLPGNSNNLIPDIPPLTIAENQETPENGEQNDEKMAEAEAEAEQNGDFVEQISPSKRQRIDSYSSPGSSLMEQVARISAMVNPHIAAAAADAAIASLCEENPWPRDIFEDDDSGDKDFLKDELQNPTTDVETKRIVEVGEPEMEVGSTQSENQERASTKEDSDLPPTLRIRTAVATALGAAAARAKLLADQEEREIEHLVATVIGTEVKKLHCKMKHFEDLEVIMKKKRSEMDEIEEALLTEQINVLQAGFKAGEPRWKNHPSVKS